MIPNFEEFLSIYYYENDSDYYRLAVDEGSNEILVESKFEPINYFNTERMNVMIHYREQMVYAFFFHRLNDYDLKELFSFLDYQYRKYIERTGEGSLFLIFLRETIKEIHSYDFALTEVPKLSESRENLILDWIETKMKELIQEPMKDIGAEVQPDQLTNKQDNRFKHPQQMLLLERLGIIDYLNKYNLTNDKKALLISKIIGKNHQNTREYLGTIASSKHKNTCNTVKNNELIDQLFSDLGISDPL